MSTCVNSVPGCPPFAPRPTFSPMKSIGASSRSPSPITIVPSIATGVLHSPATSTPYDIGLGERTTIMQVAQAIAEHYGAPAPHVTGQFRDGDVRAAWADTARARQALDWEPRVGVTEGINRLCDWIDAQQEATPPAPTGTAAEV